MSKKKKQESVEEVLSEDLVQLDLNRLLAGIVRNLGVVAVPIEYVLDEYSNQSLSLSFDNESNLLILGLVNNEDINKEEEGSNES